MRYTPSPLIGGPLLLACLLFVVGCRSGAHYMTADDQFILADNATSQFVEEQMDAGGSRGARQLVFLASLKNDTGTEIGPGLEHGWDAVIKRLTRSGLFRVLDRQRTEIALEDAGLDRYDFESIVSTDRRPQVLEKLGKLGIHPDYILWGRYTSAYDAGGGPHRYGFSLRGVDIRTGELISIASTESRR